MSVRRLDVDHELLVLNATFATVTAFGDDEPTRTTSFRAAPGTATNLVVDLDAVAVSPLDSPASKPVTHTYDSGRRHNWRRKA